MMPAFNAFPATYPGQMYAPQYQPVYQPVQQQTQHPQQMMTPPTIRAEIVQVDGEDAAKTFPVGAGASQMMIARDDSAIFVKTAMANGQTTLDVYVKRPPAPPAPVFDPADYVRRDELESLIKAAITSQNAPKRAEKKVEES